MGSGCLRVFLVSTIGSLGEARTTAVHRISGPGVSLLLVVAGFVRVPGSLVRVNPGWEKGVFFDTGAHLPRIAWWCPRSWHAIYSYA